MTKWTEELDVALYFDMLPNIIIYVVLLQRPLRIDSRGMEMAEVNCIWPGPCNLHNWVTDESDWKWIEWKFEEQEQEQFEYFNFLNANLPKIET